MGTKILYVLLGLFLVGVFNIIYSVAIMFVTIFILGIDNELFRQVQSVVIFLLAVATSAYLIYKIWPRKTTMGGSAEIQSVPD